MLFEVMVITLGPGAPIPDVLVKSKVHHDTDQQSPCFMIINKNNGA